MKKLTIKRIGVTSVAKFVGIVNALVAVIVGLVGVISAIVNLATTTSYPALEAFGIFAAVAVAGLVLYPIVMFILGWLYGALVAFIFNVFVGVSGGIAVDVEEDK